MLKKFVITQRKLQLIDSIGELLSIDFKSGDLYDRYNANVQEKCLIGLRESIQTLEIIYVTFDSSCFCVQPKFYLLS